MQHANFAKSFRSVDEAVAELKEAAGAEPIRNVVLVRAVRALAQVIRESDSEGLREAAGARADFELLVEVLRSSPVLTGSASPQLIQARLRGLQAKRQLLDAEGGCLTVSEVAALLHISRQAVDKRRRSRQLIGVSSGRRGYLYPAWQLEDAVLPHVPEVLLALAPEHEPWGQISFFLRCNRYLDGETPLAALRQGRIDDVLAAAVSHLEHGAE